MRRVLSDLCDLWEKSADDERRFRAEVDLAQATSIHTHAHHAVRLGRAILALDEGRFGAEMVPLVRFLLECGVTAAWLLLTPGSGQTLIRDGADSRRKALVELAELGEEVNPGYDQALEALAHLEDASKAYQVKHRCESLIEGKRLYVLYRVLSAESHAGMGVADLYTVSMDDSPIGIAFDDAPRFSTRASTLGIAACMLLLAINADELARIKPRRTTQIAKLAKRLGVGTRIVRADGSELPPRT
ncbi:hypothetical protein QSU92_01185 [Microbacterium sp. ET2]|uniref:DUF5677 domain-containing protein n=1 Tax=Microbacterium albipurpureum TaxID=3050384 RepID=UPI00259D2749|nr:DUF5677 domain-containing protein [Microbacterium sp. ET2 (Ac-2212)]WJL95870.1 hypothetical protein QSU92_01185 [Microbacterium sp. ET2 (Ac-2212)]